MGEAALPADTGLPAGSPQAATARGRSSRRRDPERSSAAILAAAIEEFKEKGYDGARVDAIAKSANINKRMLYHYFGGKDALYLAVLEHSYASIRSAEAALVLSKRDPVEGIRELVRFTWKYFLEHPEFLSLLGTENLLKARFLKRSPGIHDLHSPLISEISTLLQRGAEKGVFRKGHDPVKVYVSIAALVCFYLSNNWTLSTIFRRDFSARAEIDLWGAHVEDVILNFLRGQEA